HNGATLASFLNIFAFRMIFGTTVSIEELRAHDPHLRQLYDFYRQQADAFNIHTKTYYEQRRKRGFLIVNPTSSQAGTGEPAVRLDEDHLSIAKPRSRDSQVYMTASDILRNYVLFSPATRQLMQREPEVAVVETAPRPLDLHIKVETPSNRSD